jgi:hypothetical protein
LQAAAMDINKVIQLLDDEEDYGDWDDDIICNGSDDDLCIDDDDVCTSFRRKTIQQLKRSTVDMKEIEMNVSEFGIVGANCEVGDSEDDTCDDLPIDEELNVGEASGEVSLPWSNVLNNITLQPFQRPVGPTISVNEITPCFLQFFTVCKSVSTRERHSLGDICRGGESLLRNEYHYGNNLLAEFS